MLRWTFAALSRPGFALARYNSDGTLDTSFGTGGKVTTDFDSETAALRKSQQPSPIVPAPFKAESRTADEARECFIGVSRSDRKNLAPVIRLPGLFPLTRKSKLTFSSLRETDAGQKLPESRVISQRIKKRVYLERYNELAVL